MIQLRRKSRFSPVRVAVGYLIFGVLWILLSDHAVTLAGHAGADVAKLQSIKGIAFVVLSALLVYGLVKREVAAVTRTSLLLAAVAEGTTDALFVKDVQGKYLLFNEAAGRFVGMRPEQVVGQDDSKLFDAKSAQLIRENDRRVLQLGKAETTVEELTAIGVTRFYMATKAPYLDESGKIIGIVGISRDISDRVVTERSLEHSRAMLQSFVENTPAAVAMLDKNLCYIAVSKRWLQDYHLGERDLRGLHHYDVFPEIRSLPHWQAIHQRCLAGAFERSEEDSFVRADGHVEWVRWEMRPWLDEKGNIGGVIMFTEVITQRKLDAQKLAQSEERFRTIVQTTSEWLWSMDLSGHHTFSNPAVTPILGFTPQEVETMDMRALMHPDDLAACSVWLPDAIAAKRGWQNVVIRMKHKDGSYRWLESNASPMLDSDGNIVGFFGADRDITARKLAEEALRESEEQLRQAKKMESIGQMAGGIAHDFNNLLTVITGYCELLQNMTPADDARSNLLAGIADAGSRAATLTRQLLAFSRRQVLEPRIIDLNEAVRETGKMLRRMIGEDVRLVTDLHPGTCPVKVDPGQIGQVIMNLAVNARDAMPDGGTFTLQTSEVDLQEDFLLRHSDARLGRYIMLLVSDTGTGMSDEVKSRIFEPFFTTKGVGQGTGLGLPVVHGIVKQSEGHIELESELGQGTTFRIYLPAHHEQPVQHFDQTRKIDTQGRETILLVEDEESVRQFAAIALQSQGYTVIATASGADAIKQMAADHSRINLLVTDVVMPEMNGRKVADILTARYPGLRTLFISGYTDDIVVKRDSDITTEAFLHKPFTSTALAQKVRELLDRV